MQIFLVISYKIEKLFMKYLDKYTTVTVDEFIRSLYPMMEALKLVEKIIAIC